MVEDSFNLLLFGILLQLPYVIDGTTQALGFRESNNYLRFVTGFFGGIGVVLLARFVRFLVNDFLFQVVL